MLIHLASAALTPASANEAGAPLSGCCLIWRACAQVPIQLASAALMLVSADWAEQRLAAADIASITALFFALVLLAATQDIAVDGWALTLLSRANIGCASFSLRLLPYAWYRTPVLSHHLLAARQCCHMAGTSAGLQG